MAMAPSLRHSAPGHGSCVPLRLQIPRHEDENDTASMAVTWLRGRASVRSLGSSRARFTRSRQLRCSDSENAGRVSSPSSRGAGDDVVRDRHASLLRPPTDRLPVARTAAHTELLVACHVPEFFPTKRATIARRASISPMACLTSLSATRSKQYSSMWASTLKSRQS